MSFFQNTCKPKGIGGKIMVNMMNSGHSSMAEWGFTHIEIAENNICLDIGCGGGANVKKLLEKSPHGKVTGIDYSEISVEKSQKINKAEISNKRCKILQGNVMELPVAGKSLLVVGYSVLLCGLCGGGLRLSPCPVFPRLDTVILPLLFKVSRPVLP